MALFDTMLLNFTMPLSNTAQIVDQKGKKIEKQYEDTSDSTVKRTLDEMGKNSRPIL